MACEGERVEKVRLGIIGLGRKHAENICHKISNTKLIAVGNIFQEELNGDRIQRASGKGSDWLQKAEAAKPFGHLLRPDDCAYLVAHLLSLSGSNNDRILNILQSGRYRRVGLSGR